MVVLNDKFSGQYAPIFWAMVVLVFVVPLFVFLFKGKKSIGWLVGACVLVNIGMWLERFIVIVPTEASPRLLPYLGSGAYQPTWVEAVITLSLFAGMCLLYAVFTRFFPIVPVWETAEHPAGHVVEPAAMAEAK